MTLIKIFEVFSSILYKVKATMEALWRVFIVPKAIQDA